MVKPVGGWVSGLQVGGPVWGGWVGDSGMLDISVSASRFVAEGQGVIGDIMPGPSRAGEERGPGLAAFDAVSAGVILQLSEACQVGKEGLRGVICLEGGGLPSLRITWPPVVSPRWPLVFPSGRAAGECRSTFKAASSVPYVRVACRPFQVPCSVRWRVVLFWSGMALHVGKQGGGFHLHPLQIHSGEAGCQCSVCVRYGVACSLRAVLCSDFLIPAFSGLLPFFCTACCISVVPVSCLHRPPFLLAVGAPAQWFILHGFVV